MPTCSASGCKKNEGHRFPKDAVLRRAWLVAMKRANFLPSKSAVVCSAHFKPSDYATEGFDTGLPLIYKRLKKGAVPSIFSWKKKLESTVAEDRTARFKGLEANRKSVQSHTKTVSSALPSTAEEGLNEEQIVMPAFVDCGTYSMNDATYEDEDVVDKVNVCSTVEDVPYLMESTVSEVNRLHHGKNIKNMNVQCANISVCLKCGTARKKGMVSAATQTSPVSPFSCEKFRNKPKCMVYYTGLESFEKFMLVFDTLGPAVHELNYRWNSVVNVSAEDQFLMTLIKLRRAEPDLGLSIMFDVSEKTVSNIVVAWINFMALEWSKINTWPSRDLIDYYMPDGFKNAYPSTRVIIDPTELPIAKPTPPTAQQATLSTSKNRNTLKVKVVTTPGGLLSYCSPAYGGSTSVRALVEGSDLLVKCDRKDSIMADQGCNVRDIFAPKDIVVNIPASIKGEEQLPGMTVLEGRKHASERVHLEQLIGLTKTYKIVRNKLSPYYTALASEIFFVCFVLCNFREGIVGRKA